tara:strand:- start:16766 stop:22363 length:5598 start_codon:yes stop_codon:yes gene_type:complete
MPEIKHNFTRGKMNKDLDERIVVNGEYRDAMNIQLSTSDDSDIGTIQNILGNTEVDHLFSASILDANSKCIGSIADEKNNKMYYFISDASSQIIKRGTPLHDAYDANEGYTWEESTGINVSIPTGTQSFTGNTISSDGTAGNPMADQYGGYLQRFNLNNGVQYNLEVRFDNVDEAGDSSSMLFFVMGDSANGGDGSYRPTVTNSYLDSKATSGTHIKSFIFDKDQNNGLNAMVLYLQITNAHTHAKSIRFTWASIIEGTSNYILEHDTENHSITPVFVDPNGDVLNFQHDQLITGINIVDDMLFWTDNNSEPRKINITRCKAGTNPNGAEKTEIINKNQGYLESMVGTLPVMQEEHTTIIKKSPIYPPIVDIETFRDKSKHYSAYMEISDIASNPNDFINSSKGRVHNFSYLKSGDTFRTNLHSIIGLSDYSLEWKEGDEVVLKEYDPDDTVPNTPVTDYRIKGTIINWPYSSFSTINVLMNSNGDLSSGSNGAAYNWNFDTGFFEKMWRWPGGKLECKHISSWFPVQPQYAWSPLLQDITNGEDYEISFTVGETSVSTFQGILYVLLSNNDDGAAFELIDTIDVNSSNGGWDTFSHTITFTPSGYMYNTALGGSSPLTEHKNSIIFIADSDAYGDFFIGSIDDIVVKRVVASGAQAVAEIRINSINGIPPRVQSGETTLKYIIDLYDDEEKIFEFKFPRFAYRYKYIDGEYSTFSPFSQVAFIAGSFDYHPTKGYNKGMTNTLKSLTLKGFLTNIPFDVQSVDILYKEEDSLNIYIVDNIKDFNKTEYKITSETLKNGLTQSNQLLRSWDNVPRKALAQEVVGNRIVYGNYTQNYDLIDSVSNKDYSVDLLPEILSKQHPSGEVGYKSIKSLREYQIGIVYADKYGRQTPILTNENATTTIGKNKAENINELRISIGNEGHPVNMEYFKFYIKEVSGEYYNMAMDRYYDAEDDNIWIAFPSSDRDKISIDDFLLLKKGVDSNKLIKETARYKVIDIQNEAPDHIKRDEFMIASRRHSNTTGLELFSSSDLPKEKDVNFSIDYARIKSSSFSNLPADFNSRISDKYYITISNATINKVSNRYELIALNIDDPDNIDKWIFTVKAAFRSEINEFTDDPKGENSTIILDDTYLNIYKSTIDNSPRFDGRFFVKIYNDDIFKRNVIPEISKTKIEYQTVDDGERKIYYLETDTDTDRILKHYNATNGLNTVFLDCDTNAAVAPFDLSSDVSDSPPINLNWADYMTATSEMGERCGTLNDEGSWSSSSSTNNYYTDVWMHYDAYFRAFNVDPDGINARKEKMDIHGDDAQTSSFEDVWFIDGGRTSGSFENSNNSSHSGWDSKPNPRNGTGIGVRNYNVKSRIELAFGGIQPNNWENIAAVEVENPKGDVETQFSALHARDETFYDLQNGNLNYSSSQGNFINNLSVGSQFRFKEDPMGNIYTITDVDIIFKLRYEDITTGLPEEKLNSSNYADYENFDWDPNDTYPQVLKKYAFPLQSAAKHGTKVGMGICSSEVTNNSGGAINQPAGDSITGSVDGAIYKTSTFFRASNFTKNYRIWLDKKLEWDPTNDGSVSEITNGQSIKVGLANTTHGVNYVDVTGINSTNHGVKGPLMKMHGGVPLNDPLDTQTKANIFEDKRKIEVGMVVEKVTDDGVATTTTNPDMLPMVAKIEEGVGVGTHRIYFKNYYGGNSLTGTGVSGSLAIATSSAFMVFKQYPMNGLSPNSAKNLNHFRHGVGFTNATSDGSDVGTDALGYTIEFIKEKTSRPVEDILPPNPAIWETEPSKPETDLDIYYAVGGFNSINIPNITNFIPIGSLIQHENSNAIPPGTIITDIAEDGTITLSSEIMIDPVNQNIYNDGQEPHWGHQGN